MAGRKQMDAAGPYSEASYLGRGPFPTWIKMDPMGSWFSASRAMARAREGYLPLRGARQLRKPTSAAVPMATPRAARPVLRRQRKRGRGRSQGSSSFRERARPGVFPPRAGGCGAAQGGSGSRPTWLASAAMAAGVPCALVTSCSSTFSADRLVQRKWRGSWADLQASSSRRRQPQDHSLPLGLCPAAGPGLFLHLAGGLRLLGCPSDRVEVPSSRRGLPLSSYIRSFSACPAHYCIS